MSKKNAKKLSEAVSSLEAAKATIEEIRDDLQSAFDEKSERWQEGEAGEAAHAEIETLENGISSLDDALSSLGEIEGVS